MQTETTHNTPAMVPADHVAASVLEAFTTIRRTKEEKAAGVSTALVKAQGFARQGTSPALMAALSVNRKANMALVHAQALLGMVQGDQVRFSLAIPQVLAVAETAYTYGVDIHADGTRHAKRADWLAVGAMLQSTIDATDTPKAKRARFVKAMQLHAEIQALADSRRQQLAAPEKAADQGTAPTE